MSDNYEGLIDELFDEFENFLAKGEEFDYDYFPEEQNEDNDCVDGACKI